MNFVRSDSSRSELLVVLKHGLLLAVCSTSCRNRNTCESEESQRRGGRKGSYRIKEGTNCRFPVAMATARRREGGGFPRVIIERNTRIIRKRRGCKFRINRCCKTFIRFKRFVTTFKTIVSLPQVPCFSIF